MTTLPLKEFITAADDQNDERIVSILSQVSNAYAHSLVSCLIRNRPTATLKYVYSITSRMIDWSTIWTRADIIKFTEKLYDAGITPYMSSALEVSATFWSVSFVTRIYGPIMSTCFRKYAITPQDYARHNVDPETYRCTCTTTHCRVMSALVFGRRDIMPSTDQVVVDDVLENILHSHYGREDLGVIMMAFVHALDFGFSLDHDTTPVIFCLQDMDANARFKSRHQWQNCVKFIGHRIKWVYDAMSDDHLMDMSMPQIDDEALLTRWASLQHNAEVTIPDDMPELAKKQVRCLGNYGQYIMVQSNDTGLLDYASRMGCTKLYRETHTQYSIKYVPYPSIIPSIKQAMTDVLSGLLYHDSVSEVVSFWIR